MNRKIIVYTLIGLLMSSSFIMTSAFGEYNQKKFVKDETFMLTYGDGVANINIKDLIQFHKSHGKILTVTGVHGPARFGEIIDERNVVISFKEKPQTSLGLMNGGFIVFNNEFLDFLTPNEDCDLEKGVLEELSRKREVMVYKHDGYWECMDHERDVVHLNKVWEDNEAMWKIWS